MGWLIGFAGANAPAKPPLQHRDSRYEIIEDDLHAQAGGPVETCLYGPLPRERQFIVLGLGIRDGRILTQNDWAYLLNQSHVDVDDLDGHFIIVRWGAAQVECFTDCTGVRTLYYRPWSGGILFSTRLDWLAIETSPLDIDYYAFGAQWFFANSISTSSVIKQVSRLESGAHAIIKKRNVQITSKRWECEVSPVDIDGSRYERTMRQSLNIRGHHSWSLGLSGGLDSRVLCSIGKNIPTHSWGPLDHPDVQISRQVAQAQGIEQQYFEHQLPDVDRCISYLRERVGLTQVITPASASVQRSAYCQLYQMGRGIIDGGFGEIARRQLFNQLVLERTIHGDSVRRPLKIPAVGKADIFNSEVQEYMVVAAQQELNDAWTHLPQSVSIADKADWISIRSRLPNFFGFEQNYLDNECISYMPYAQPSVLRALFQVPLRLRWHGRLLRHMLKRSAPTLSSYPLVKGTITYPFSLGTFSSYAYTHFKKRIGMDYCDRRTEMYLYHMREYILDTLRSHSVLHYEPYDQTKLQSFADGLARGDVSNATQLDWWLTFDMWRKVLSLESQ